MIDGPIAQLVQSARLISVRSVVQIYLGPPNTQKAESRRQKEDL